MPRGEARQPEEEEDAPQEDFTPEERAVWGLTEGPLRVGPGGRIEGAVAGTCRAFIDDETVNVAAERPL